MADFASLGSMGATQSKAGGTTIAHTTTTTNAPAGTLVVVIVAKDNLSGTSTSAGTEVTSITDSVGGNTWTKIGEQNYSNGGGAADGANVSAFYSVLTNALNTGAVITANCAGAVTSKAISAWAYSVTAATAALDATKTAFATGAAVDFGASGDNLDANKEWLRIIGYAGESATATQITPTSGYTAFSAQTTAGGSGVTNIAVRGEFKLVPYVGEAWLAEGTIPTPSSWALDSDPVWNGSYFLQGHSANTSVYKSTDGKTWTQHTTNISVNMSGGMVWVAGLSLWVAVNRSAATVTTSTDGITWTTPVSLSPMTSPGCLCWNGTKLFVVDRTLSSRLASSTDGVSWTHASTKPLARNYLMGANPTTGRLVLLNAETNSTYAAQYSTNEGASWTATSFFTRSGTTGGWEALHFGTRWVAFGTNGANKTAYSDDDGETWSTLSTTTPEAQYGYNSTLDRYFVGDRNGNNSSCYGDGATAWTVVFPTPGWPRTVWGNPNLFGMNISSSPSLTSPDGVHNAPVNESNNPTFVACDHARISFCFYSVSLDQTVTASAIASAQALGTATVTSVVAPSAIATSEAIGTAVVQGSGGVQFIVPDTIASAEAMGAIAVIIQQYISPSGLPSAESFGASVLGGGVIEIYGDYAVGLIGTAYTGSGIASRYGFPAYTYTVTAGSLPAGLSIVSGTGALTGTPTTFGTSSFTVRSTGSDGNYTERVFSLKIVPYAPDYCEVVAYTGNGSSGRTIGSLDLSAGGLILIKRRVGTETAELYYSADGTTVYRQQIAFDDAGGSGGSPDATPMVTPTGTFTAAGFTQSGTVMNTNGATYMAWMFRKTPGFLDVLTYTGNGASGDRLITHTLGAQPVFGIASRSDSDATGVIRNYNLYNGGVRGAWDLGIHGWSAASIGSLPTATQMPVVSTYGLNDNTVTYVMALFGSDPDMGAQLLKGSRQHFTVATMLTHNSAQYFTRRVPLMWMRLITNSLDIVDATRNSNWVTRTTWIPDESQIDEDTGTTDSPYSVTPGKVRQTFLYDPFAAPPQSTNNWGYEGAFYYIEKSTLAAGIYPTAIPSNENFGNATVAIGLTISEPRALFCYKSAYFTYTPVAMNSAGGTAWSISAGSLPPGISLASGVLLGTATKSGVYDFTLQAVEGITTVTRDMRIVVGTTRIQRHAQVIQYIGDGTGSRFIPTTCALDRGGVVMVQYIYGTGVDPNYGPYDVASYHASRHGEAPIEFRKQAGSPFFYNSTSSVTFARNGFTLTDVANTNATGRKYTVLVFSRDDNFCDIYDYTGDGTRREILHGLQATPALVGTIRTTDGSSGNGYYAADGEHYTFDYTEPSPSGYISAQVTGGSSGIASRNGPNANTKIYKLFAISAAFTDEVYSSNVIPASAAPYIYTPGWPAQWMWNIENATNSSSQSYLAFSQISPGWGGTVSALYQFYVEGGSFYEAIPASARFARSNTTFTVTGPSTPLQRMLLFRDPGLDQEILPTAIASAGAFGTAVLTTGPVSVAPSGIASAEAFGTHSVQFVLAPSAIAGAEAFGTLLIFVSSVSILPSGLASAEFLCANTIVSIAGGAQYVQPYAITSGEAFGTLSVGHIVYPSAINSDEAFGTALLTSYLTPSAIASDEVFGTPVVGRGIAPAGIASAEAFGTLRTTLYILPTGIATREAHGTGTLMNKRIYPTGLASAEAFGSHEVVNGVRAVGIGSQEAVNAPRINITVPVQSFHDSAVGTPSISFPVYPSAIASEQAVGAPSLSLRIYVEAIDASVAVNAPRVRSVLGASSIASEAIFGTPTLIFRQMILPSSMNDGEAMGVPYLDDPNAVLFPAAIIDGESVGTPKLSHGVRVSSLDSAEAFGAHNVARGTVSIVPEAIASALAVGSPVVVAGGVVISVVGVSTAESLGSHIVSFSFAQEILPPSIGSTGEIEYPVVSGGCESATIVVVRSQPAPTVIVVGEC